MARTLGLLTSCLLFVCVCSRERVYYVGIIEDTWDYAPSGKNLLNGNDIANDEWVEMFREDVSLATLISCIIFWPLGVVTICVSETNARLLLKIVLQKLGQNSLSSCQGVTVSRLPNNVYWQREGDSWITNCGWFPASFDMYQQNKTISEK